MTAPAFEPPPRGGASSIGADVPVSFLQVQGALDRCKSLVAKLPPMEGSVRYKRAWGIEEALEQHQSLMRQHDAQSTIGQNHSDVRKTQATFARIEAATAAAQLKEVLASGCTASSEAARKATERAREASRRLRTSLQLCEVEDQGFKAKMKKMEEEIEKSNTEMVVLREAIDDVAAGGGPVVAGMQGNGPAPSLSVEKERKWYYCADCRVGGHGQRFCQYLLKRPNWRVYPSEKWFEDKNGQASYCPLGKRGVDFADETYFSRMAMHIKGRIWLEDKRKLYEFVPDLMPFTYVIENMRWIGNPPPAQTDDVPLMPWFVKETDRNWGTSVLTCQRPEECMGLAKPQSTYVVQRHIERPLLYNNGEKLHIKFYNLLYGLEDGQTWRLYCFKDGYLCVSPKPWSPTDLSKEGQVTIIRTKRINDWPHWERVYPLCRESMRTVISRAVEQGKLEGRVKKQFEIISADFMVTEDFEVSLLEFNTGPVLKDPEDSPEVNDAGMIMGALHIVEPWEHGDNNQWDFALECKGAPLKSAETMSDML
eukprot:TRINITY_DN24238_c0_g1_i2.p1 TRINITY_DN24238_c0_g1~~TRINITY_DN24238_c0_g1_i2.p1  ORF type:complete len:573 (-),score=120.26 TRINITY_DN24238_c0_g1_i2:379-1992(-)